jgi:hypothetical protein
LDSSPRFPGESTSPPPIGDERDAGARKPSSTASAAQAARTDAGTTRDALPINTARNQAAVADDEDAGKPVGMPDASDGSQPEAGAAEAGPTGEAEPTVPDTTSTPATNSDPDCGRDALRRKADAYFLAMASGATTSLRPHPSLRYTENGRDTALGAGVWQRRPKTDFVRHVLDEARCSTLSHGVLSALTARIVFGVRLRYQDGQLLEVEAQSVPDDATLTDIAAIIPNGADRWVEAVPEATRMSRAALEAFAEQYFNAANGGGDVPPSAPECTRRQNGIPMSDQGSCRVAPGSMRFEQRRFDVVDETNGILTAAVVYDSHVGFYLFKMAGDIVLNIEVVGGATVLNSGW